MQIWKGRQIDGRVRRRYMDRLLLRLHWKCTSSSHNRKARVDAQSTMSYSQVNNDDLSEPTKYLERPRIYGGSSGGKTTWSSVLLQLLGQIIPVVALSNPACSIVCSPEPNIDTMFLTTTFRFRILQTFDSSSVLSSTASDLLFC